jgi:hypothetical protein
MSPDFMLHNTTFGPHNELMWLILTTKSEFLSAPHELCYAYNNRDECLTRDIPSLKYS